MNNPSPEEARELINQLRSEYDRASSDDPSSDTLSCLGTACQLIDILAARVQMLEAEQSRVDYVAQARAQRDEAEAKRDLAQLLLGVARSVTSWFRPTVQQ